MKKALAERSEFISQILSANDASPSTPSVTGSASGGRAPAAQSAHSSSGSAR